MESTERKLRNLYQSPGANKQRERLQIAHIFQKTNFGFGKQSKFILSSLLTFLFLDQYNAQPSSLSNLQYPRYSDVKKKFDIGREKAKMRQTNYNLGEL